LWLQPGRDVRVVSSVAAGLSLRAHGVPGLSVGRRFCSAYQRTS